MLHKSITLYNSMLAGPVTIKIFKKNYLVTSAKEMTPHGFAVGAMFIVNIESELSRAPARGFIKRT